MGAVRFFVTGRYGRACATRVTGPAERDPDDEAWSPSFAAAVRRSPPVVTRVASALCPHPTLLLPVHDHVAVGAEGVVPKCSIVRRLFDVEGQPRTPETLGNWALLSICSIVLGLEREKGCKDRGSLSPDARRNVEHLEHRKVFNGTNGLACDGRSPNPEHRLELGFPDMSRRLSIGRFGRVFRLFSFGRVFSLLSLPF